MDTNTWLMALGLIWVTSLFLVLITGRGPIGRFIVLPVLVALACWGSVRISPFLANRWMQAGLPQGTPPGTVALLERSRDQLSQLRQRADSLRTEIGRLGIQHERSRQEGWERSTARISEVRAKLGEELGAVEGTIALLGDRITVVETGLRYGARPSSDSSAPDSLVANLDDLEKALRLAEDERGAAAEDRSPETLTRTGDTP